MQKIYLILILLLGLTLTSFSQPDDDDDDDDTTLAFYRSLNSNLRYLFTFEDYSSTSGARNLVSGSRSGRRCPADGSCAGNPTLPTRTACGICGQAPIWLRSVKHAIRVNANLNSASYSKMTWGAWVKPYPIASNTRYAILSCDNGGYDRHLAIDNRGINSANVCPNRPGHFVAFRGSTGNIGVVEPTSAVDKCRDPSHYDWHFVAASYFRNPGATLGTLTFYVGFAGENSLTYRSFQTRYGTSKNFFTIGGNPGLGAELWNGLIDEVFVYNDTLSYSRINSIYQFSKRGCTPPPLT